MSQMGKKTVTSSVAKTNQSQNQRINEKLLLLDKNQLTCQFYSISLLNQKSPEKNYFKMSRNPTLETTMGPIIV